MINWKVRLKNRAFWLSAIPAALLLAQTVAALFGARWESASWPWSTPCSPCCPSWAWW